MPSRYGEGEVLVEQLGQFSQRDAVGCDQLLVPLLIQVSFPGLVRGFAASGCSGASFSIRFSLI